MQLQHVLSGEKLPLSGIDKRTILNYYILVPNQEWYARVMGELLLLSIPESRVKVIKLTDNTYHKHHSGMRRPLVPVELHKYVLNTSDTEFSSLTTSRRIKFNKELYREAKVRS